MYIKVFNDRSIHLRPLIRVAEAAEKPFVQLLQGDAKAFPEKFMEKVIIW